MKKTFNKEIYDLLWDLIELYGENNDSIEAKIVEEYAKEIEKIAKKSK